MATKVIKAVNDMRNKHIKITIHAGAHKTATTHLQNRLLKMKTCLRKAVAHIWGPKKSVRNSELSGKHWNEKRKINNKKEKVII